jgi:arylsulfatase A-like enzyme
VDTDHIVSIGLDVLPTLLDFAAAEKPASLPGASVKPLVDGHAAQTVWRDHSVLQCEFGGWGPDQQTGIRGRCVRSAQYKYILYHDPAAPDEETNEQLFHLPSDPGETNNLVRNADYQRELHRHRRMLLDHAEATNDTQRMPFKASAFVNLPEGNTHFLAPEVNL